MNTLTLFAVQVGIPLLLGLAATCYLRDVTRHLLTEICGTGERAEFWVRVIAVLTTATPIVLVLLCGYTPGGTTGYPEAAYIILRQTLWLSLGGIVGAVGVLAHAIWQQIPQHQRAALAALPTTRPATEEEVPCAS